MISHDLSLRGAKRCQDVPRRDKMKAGLPSPWESHRARRRSSDVFMLSLMETAAAPRCSRHGEILVKGHH